ncbi:MAG: RidA family protein [Hyphomonadaceae bacterium]
MSARYINPPDVHVPKGLYSHGVLLPAGADILFVAGQIGARLDGSWPQSIGEQADLAFANLLAVLAAAGMEAGHIVKLNTYIVKGQDGAAVRAAREQHLGAHRPASTAVYVAALVHPEWKVEIEAIAAKPKEG